MSIKVRATKPGTHGLGVKKEGDVFILEDIHTKDEKGKPKVHTADQQFSGKWMERVSGKSEHDDEHEEQMRKKQEAKDAKGGRVSDQSKI